ncbi:MAG TPA: MBL fold metallo-hydrolase [Xanthobacteraceae bacterium]|nr:MBL fold metallo-hydrolase [Xanthobacteraceae bacterium]
MPAFICATCGSQFTPSQAPPPSCPICEDERQYVPPGGQKWTTLDELAPRHFNCYQQYEPGLIGVGTVPEFAIGQRALILRAADGNVLWDCISFIDAATIELVKGLGGLAAIAISHPHYYSTMVEWSRAFGGIPIYLPAADRQWIMRPDPVIKLWEGDTLQLAPGITLIRCGGHFAGGTVLHWAGGGQGRGALLSGDIVQLIPDRKHVSFMRSYPNLIPLSAPAVARIGAILEPFSFDVIYGAWFDRVIPRGGKDAVKRSVARYIAMVEGDGTAEQR